MSVSHPQGPILHSVVFLFQHLLCHPHWLVLHYTLLAFRHFAEVAHAVLVYSGVVWVGVGMCTLYSFQERSSIMLKCVTYYIH